MFRRLAESFTDGSHTGYLTGQTAYFDTLPNLIPSATPGLKGFETAIQTVNTINQTIQPPVVPQPDEIFRPVISQELRDRARVCETSSVDQLIAAKNPSLAPGDIACGWIYTPPVAGSPYPQLSKGFLGNDQGPLNGLTPPEYKKWFFDLALAKKQAMIDKCKALKACTDLDSEVFKGSCGFCTTTNQGVPVDQVGKLLYPTDGVGGCQEDAVITARGSCPPPQEVVGPQPMVDRTCDPVGGRLSSTCLYRLVMTGGCRDNGSLAVALSGNDPNRDVLSLRNSDMVKIYNRVANPPLQADLFQQGRATVDQVLKEVRQLSAAAQSGSETSAMGAAARDLCLRKGDFARYDICQELADGTPSPFELVCLQRLFLSMGGQAAGTSYPTAANLSSYNSLGNWGAVKQQLQTLVASMSSKEYDVQRDAMIQFLGISPERSIQRAPYQQGVEVFWFVPVPGQPNRVAGFLRRTIERDVVQLQAGPSRVAQIGGGAYGCMVQMTDVRAPQDASMKFSVVVDDGFWVAVNQPADIDKTAMRQYSADRPGLFENLGLQGPTLYNSQTCTPFNAATPNIMKLFFEDAGGGWNAFQFSMTPCSGNAISSPYYSLTCEVRAPFLCYEVGLSSGLFEEQRNPGLFGQFLGLQNLEYRLRAEERAQVPGRKGFVRINQANSLLDMYNIAFQSWKTMTVMVRLTTMPVEETLLKMAMGVGYLSLVLRPLRGSMAALSVEHTIGGKGERTIVTTTISMTLNKWYCVIITNKGSGFDVNCSDVDTILATKASASGNWGTVKIVSPARVFGTNATWQPAPGQRLEQCTIMMGSKGFAGRADWPGMYATSAFQYDLAWIHFFDQYVNSDDIYRDCMANWIYTTFPKEYGVY